MEVKNADGTRSRVPSKSNGRGLRYRAVIVDEIGDEQTKAFRRKEDARKWLESQSAAIFTGTYVDPRLGRTTLAGFYQQWSKHQVWVPGTRRAMDLAVNSATFGDVPFADLRPSHVQAWIKTMQDKPLEASTIRTRFTNVRGVIRAALQDRLLTRDVTAAIKLPRLRKASAAQSIPLPEEVGRLIADCDPHFAAFVSICAFAGLRLGEAAALRASDVDFLRREIRISRQVQRAKGKQVELRAPKYGSERVVYAADELIATIGEHIRLQVPHGEPDRWLFPGEGEHPLHQNSVGYLWRKAREAAGVDYRLHDLRHFYASGLINAGCDVVTVQRALGHSNPSVTLNTYGHLWPDANDRTRQAARDLYALCTAHTAYPVRTRDAEKPAALQF
jgi:integrase